MFIGSYYHRLEGKGRVSLPKAFRHLAGSDWVITPGLDGGLFVFPSQDFTRELQRLAQLEFNKADQRNFVRQFTNQAQPVTLDKTGRLLIPEQLLKLAHLSKEVVIVGSLTRLEIWDQTTYHQLLDQLNQTAESIAERIEWGSLPANSQDSTPLSPRSGV